ncbi:hypothetical protein SAMN02745164_01914 [Marinitoga hydrogenitolerans DSM 16785]|uniref:Wadjet protein JetD C-terminal domain-containing protein n=1 Tax=Marinitoga hydrogenitolerans (strain DSM 16785 / JCM 12826 / AT1271) TaxID=1122195 RepID=A0A1M4ZEH5_MARH1|nr:Wadjet anti-phage system protein JetD domain-containing protein [Marinitoga hydrogenitolerans]SHF16420.1 hypothetical protein SAMN02745164_01914 [Marinitoga hydrogenitolerans DSM 16785]
MQIKKYLEKYSKKYITYEEIEKNINIEYEILYNEIKKLIDEKILIPIKNKKENGRYPSLPEKFRINIINKKDNLFILHPKININYYLNHMNEYQKDKEIILKIDQFLKSEKKEPVATRERAYEIFNDEKAFEKNKRILKVLKNIKINIKKDLYTFDSREPFYIFTFKPDMKKVLISENQTPFYNFYLLSKENIIPFDAVIFGEGKKILRSFEFIYEYVPKNTIFYYWGDIDYDGILILIKLIERYNEYNIYPWKEGYNLMLKRKSRDTKVKNKIKFETKDEYLKKLISIVKEKRVIPQEAIDYQQLKNLVIKDV